MKQVRAERNLRAKTREYNAAAEVIQRIWRGFSVRKVTGEEFCHAWMKKFGDVAGDPNAFLQAKEIAGEAV